MPVSNAIQDATKIGIESERCFAGSHWAIIANKDPVYGMTRMFQLSRDPQSHDVRVFREADPAIEWLESIAARARPVSAPPD